MSSIDSESAPVLVTNADATDSQVNAALGTGTAQTTNGQSVSKKRGVPEGLWLKCPGCNASVYRKEVASRLNVCPKCEYHFYVPAIERIAQVLDEGTFEPMNEHLRPTDPLLFSDRRPYAKRLVEEQQRTGLTDAVLTGTGMIRARRVAFAVTDSAFIMGSMGSVVGERLTRLIEQATLQNLPLIIISGSGGGARMHEGILSLMQMAKVSAALAKYDEAGGLYISVLTNPTMGGVAASFASLSFSGISANNRIASENRFCAAIDLASKKIDWGSLGFTINRACAALVAFFSSPRRSSSSISTSEGMASRWDSTTGDWATIPWLL